MKHLFHAAALVVLMLLCTGGNELTAQFSTTPYLAKEGLPTAEQAARDSLASDAVLIYVGTFGDYEAQGFKTTFNLDNGKAGIWGYVYYSPSLDKSVTVAVIKLLVVYQAIVIPDFPLPFPPADESVNVGLTYSNSDKLVQQLKTDTTYQRYRKELDSARPDFVSYGTSVPDNPIELPDGFPSNEPLWTVSFIGRGDSTMTCFVVAGSGATVCKRISAPQLSVNTGSSGVAGTAALSAAPNPATGRTRVTVNVPSGMSSVGAELLLYNAVGQKVMDLTESFARNGYRFVEFDASALPAGVYYCRTAGAEWNGTIGLVVGE